MAQKSQQVAATPGERRAFPIHKLPNELVDIILSLSIPSALADPQPGSTEAYRDLLRRSRARNYPRLLSQICRKWRSLVLRNASLWSYIYVRAVYWPRSEFSPKDYEEPLALSRKEPLTLVFDLKHKSIATILSSPPFAQHISRIHVLCIHVQRLHMQEHLFPIFSKTAATPALEALRIYGINRADLPWEDRGRRTILNSAPRLTEFSMVGAWEQGQDFMPLANLGRAAGIDWSHLTVLRLPDVPRWAYDLLVVVSSAPRLRAFQCTAFGEIEDDSIIEPEFKEYVSECESSDEEEAYNDSITEEERQEAAARARQRQNKMDILRKQRAVMGPHVLEYLEELHLSVGHEGMGSYGDAADEQMGVVKFLEALNTPALTKLTVSAANGLTLDESYAYDDAPTPETLLDAQENGTDPFLLEPHLSALISRSGCTIRHLALSRVFVSLPELLSIVKLCRDIRSLHLNDPLRWMRSSLLHGLATRTDEDSGLLAPQLQHLMIESIDQSTYAGFSITAVLDMVDTRWPPDSRGSTSGPVRVEVVHCPSGESEEGTPKNVVQERMCSRIAEMQARKDLELVITELKRNESI